MSGLLYANEYSINDKIKIVIPTVGEIIDNEDAYFNIIYAITATPYDMMVQLDDAGIDFTKVSEFELFCLMFRQLIEADTSLVFGDLNLSRFRTAVNQQNGNVVLWNGDDITIDMAVYDQIAKFIREMLFITKNDKKPANEEARLYLIQKERKRQKRSKNKKKKSQLENLIVSLVNTSEFPYNYQTVRDISIYQFYASLHQITRKVRFDNTMIGCYAGTVKFDELSLEDRSWLQT